MLNYSINPKYVKMFFSHTFHILLKKIHFWTLRMRFKYVANPGQIILKICKICKLLSSNTNLRKVVLLV